MENILNISSNRSKHQLTLSSSLLRTWTSARKSFMALQVREQASRSSHVSNDRILSARRGKPLVNRSQSKDIVV